MVANRRAHRRYRVAVVAEVELDGDTHIGETRDVSLGGVAVSLEREVEEKSDVGLALILTQDGIEDPNEEPFETNAEVMWNAQSDTGTWTIGLRFAPLQEPQSNQLQRFLAALEDNAEG
jgi:c-di-GMP-binding flagellar brake protein YcgR